MQETGNKPGRLAVKKAGNAVLFPAASEDSGISGRRMAPSCPGSNRCRTGE